MASYNWAIRDGKKVGIGMVDEIYELGTPEYLGISQWIRLHTHI